MFAEQDHLAWDANEPLSVVASGFGTGLAKSELLHGTANRVGNPYKVVRGVGNRASLDQCMTEIVEQVRGILDSNAKADEVLGETTGGPNSRINGSMSAQSSVNGRSMAWYGKHLRHDTRHAD